MQRLATRIFIVASIIFGVVGVLMVITLPSEDGGHSSDLNMFLSRLLMATVFVILPSFALSVAGKYLKNKS